MQKLSFAVLEKLIEKKATSAEIDVLLYVSKFQNKYGYAEGIYYRNVCEELGLSYQAFYDAKNGLIEKGIIFVEKNNYLDMDIRILNNEFLNQESFKRGYINTNYAIFACTQFRNLPGGAKLLAMDLMKNNLAGGASYQHGTKDFVRKFMRKFNICRRTLQDYLKELRLLFSIGIKDKKYFITIRKFAVEKQNKQEEEKYRQNSIDVAVRRNRIKVVRAEDRKAINELLKFYNKDIDNMFGAFSLPNIITRSLEIINAGVEKKKWKRTIKKNLIHRLIRKEIGLDVRDIRFEPVNG